MVAQRFFSGTVDTQDVFKVPAELSMIGKRKSAPDFFITSFTGEEVDICPFTMWQAFEEKVTSLARANNGVAMKFLERARFWGQRVCVGSNGRIPIPSKLRRAAHIRGKAFAFGSSTLLRLFSPRRFRELFPRISHRRYAALVRASSVRTLPENQR